MALWKRDKTWWADLTVNGERFRQSLKTSDKREAKAQEKELIAQIQAGKVAAPSAPLSSRRNASFLCGGISARKPSGASLPGISPTTKRAGSVKVCRVAQSTWR